jgi:hypothetical protein
MNPQSSQSPLSIPFEHSVFVEHGVFVEHSVLAEHGASCGLGASKSHDSASARSDDCAAADPACGRQVLLYSIRIPVPPACVPCADCGVMVLVAGPTGFREDKPVCDACLLEGAPDLGMVLVLVAVARLFGSLRLRDGEHQLQALLELGAFVRLYERYASRRAPTRGFESFLR